MSSAKRTPRYVERIPPPNIHIVGPAMEAHEAQVIPIRRVTPAYTPIIDVPLPAPAPKKGRARSVPVALRPWRVLVVSPTPGARTRSFGVSRWQGRVVLGALIVMFTLSGLAIGALVTALQTPDLFTSSADAASLRDQILELQDSLAAARADLVASEVSHDSAMAAVSAAAVAERPAMIARLSARKPVLPNASRNLRGRAGEPLAAALPSMEGMPVIGRLASGFSRSRRHPILHLRRPHLGIDVAAPRGTRVSAPAAGRVTYIGHRFGYGLVVELTHPKGIVTRYAHLSSATVAEGDKVERGAQIATVGSSGLSTGPHLHYEVLVYGHAVDPLRFRLPQSSEPEHAITTTPSAGAALASPTIAPLVVPPAPTSPTSAMHESGAGHLTPSP